MNTSNNKLDQFFNGNEKIIIPVNIEFSDEQLANNPLQNIMDKICELESENTNAANS